MTKYQIVDDNGNVLNAHYEFDGNSIIFHARGGGSENRSPTNPDYTTALKIIIKRVLHSSLKIKGAWLDSSRVQNIPIENRKILSEVDLNGTPDQILRIMSSRMKNIGRADGSKNGTGNSTKRIRIEFHGHKDSDAINKKIGGCLSIVDPIGYRRIPARNFDKVTEEHILKAIEKLRSGYIDHTYGLSKDFDVVTEEGERFPPKAVFGLAASDALGFPVLPRHFSGGLGTVCFRALEQAGFKVVPKNHRIPLINIPPTPDEREWAEGKPKLISHLKRERASGLSKAKKANFLQQHGKLFCERCGMDPVEEYGGLHGLACIEVHHNETHVEHMNDNHQTKLSELQCLCANCHRIVHCLLTK